MRIEREVLEHKLKEVISDNARSRKIVQQVTNELKAKNIIDGDVSSIFKLTTPISSVNQFVLYAFTKALFKATGEIKINPETYFTKIEIEDGDKWKQEVTAQVNKGESIIFNQYLKVNNNTWMVIKTVQELYDMFNNRILVYNVNTQRPLKITERNGKIIEKIDINQNSVHEMENLMLEDLYFPDPLTINALNNESLDMEENDKNKSLTILSGELDLTDGWHRLRSYFKALVKNPNMDINVPIMLTRLTEDRAREYIYQKSKHNPLNKEFVKTINPTRLSNQIIDFLNTEKKSLLRGRIAKDTIMLKAIGSKAVVEFNTLADTIDFTFAPKEQADLFVLNKSIMNGLNHIINIYGDLLKEYSEAKQWCIYICMLYLVKDLEDWETALDDLLVEVKLEDIQFKAINKIGIRNILSEISKFLPECENDDLIEEGADQNGE